MSHNVIIKTETPLQHVIHYFMSSCELLHINLLSSGTLSCVQDSSVI